MTQAQTA